MNLPPNFWSTPESAALVIALVPAFLLAALVMAIVMFLFGRTRAGLPVRFTNCYAIATLAFGFIVVLHLFALILGGGTRDLLAAAALGMLTTFNVYWLMLRRPDDNKPIGIRRAFITTVAVYPVSCLLVTLLVWAVIALLRATNLTLW